MTNDAPFADARSEGEVPTGDQIVYVVEAARSLVAASDAMLGASFWLAWDRLMLLLAEHGEGE